MKAAHLSHQAQPSFHLHYLFKKAKQCAAQQPSQPPIVKTSHLGKKCQKLPQSSHGKLLVLEEGEIVASTKSKKAARARQRANHRANQRARRERAQARIDGLLPAKHRHRYATRTATGAIPSVSSPYYCHDNDWK